MKKFKTSGRSTWHKDAEYRAKNRWLIYSSKIARRILASIDEKSDFSQVKLAEKLKVSPQRINTIVRGKENLTLETIYNLSQALEVELIEFPDYKYSSKNAQRSIEYRVEIDSVSASIGKSAYKKISQILMDSQPVNSNTNKVQFPQVNLFERAYCLV